MRNLFCCTLLNTFLLLIFTCNLMHGQDQITLKILKGSHEVQGTQYSWDDTTVTVDPAVLIDDQYKSTRSPGDHQPYMDNWDPWPGYPKNKAPLTLMPKATDSLMLGAPYKNIVPSSVIIKVSGKKMIEGKDYKFNKTWGQIAGINGSLKNKKLQIRYQYRLQRIDLVQVDKKGKISVKKGKDVFLCPQIPSVDEGHCPVAGIYIHPFYPQSGEAYTINSESIYYFRKIGSHVLNASSIQNSIDKLRSGKHVKIALLGDSVTEGAEAGQWWSDRSKTYTGLVIASLKNKFPSAKIEEIKAYKGGITTEKGAEFFKANVAPAKPDLLLIALGLNDASGPKGKDPKVSPQAFRAAILKMIVEAKKSQTEVILVTPFGPNPFIPLGKNAPKYVDVLLELAKTEQVACANVNQAWHNLGKRGIAPHSQLHNWINHPGAFGHTVYADCILELFKQ